MLVLPSVSKAGRGGAIQPRAGTRPIRGHQALSTRLSVSIRNFGLYRHKLSSKGHGCVSTGAASSKQAAPGTQVAIDSPTSLRAFMQALQGKADSLRALAASFAPQAAAADAETLEKVQHAVKRLKAFVSIGHSLSESYVRKLGRSINDTQALRALASHIVRIDVLASSVTAMKRSFECGGIDMGDQLSSLLESVRELRATATQAEQEAQYLQDNPEAAAKALQEDAANDAAEGAAGDTNGSSSATNGATNGALQEAAASEGTQEHEEDRFSEGSEGTVHNDVLSETDEQFDDSDSSVGVYEETTDTEDEDLESVEGLHSSIQRQRSRLKTLMTRVESLQHLAANLEAQEEGKGEQALEAVRNAVVELAKLRQMVESDDAALESHDAALGAASERASATPMPDTSSVTADPPAPVADGVTVRKMPGMEAVGTTSPHLRRRRPTVDMYTSRHERAQEENERPRHSEEISRISERILRESEGLRQELREREARMDGLPPPQPRSREEVWASARRRRPTGDYGSRRTSEGSARENASAIRRRSSASRLRPPPRSDTSPVGSDWSSREQSPYSQGSLREQESREASPDRAWEMFASGDSGRDGRSQDRSGRPFVRMRRRSSYESRRSGKAGDEENQRRRRGSVDFSVRGNKAAATDWTSTDWSDTSTPGSNAAEQNTSEGADSVEGGFWGAAKRLFGGRGSGDSGSGGSKPFVRPKKGRPQRAAASREENVQRRIVPESDPSATGSGDFWGNSLSNPVQDQGRTDDSYTRIGSSATPYVHKRKSVDYTSRYSSVNDTADDGLPAASADTSASNTGSGGFWGADSSSSASAERGTQDSYDYGALRRDEEPQQGDYTGSSSVASSGSGFWGSDTAAAGETEQFQSGFDYHRDTTQEQAEPAQTEPQKSPRSSGFWASNPTVAEAAVEAGAVLRDTGYSSPTSKPFVHRRRATKQAYAARRSSTSGGDSERRRSISDSRRRRASKTAYSAFSEASDYLAHSSGNDEQRTVPLVRKKVPDYSARRGGASRENFTTPTRRGRSTDPKSQPDVPSSNFDNTQGQQSPLDDIDGTSTADLEAQSSAFSESVSSLRDAIARRSRSDSRRRAPSRNKSRSSRSPSRGSSRGHRDEESSNSALQGSSAASDSAAVGGTDWSSDSWSPQNPSASSSYEEDSMVSSETPRPSVAVRRRKVVDYAARRSGGQGRGNTTERASARRPPQSHRVDVPAYDSEPESSVTDWGAEGNGAQRKGGAAQRGAARYSFGDSASSNSDDTRRRSSGNYNSSSRNGTNSGPRGAARYTNPPPSDNTTYASSSPTDYSNQSGAQGFTDWNDDGGASSNGTGGGKPFVKAKLYSYSSRGAGNDEENARRGRLRSLDARRR